MSWAWFWFIMFVIVCSMTGCITVPDNPCSMANMTASELEHALEHGCGH